MTLDATQARANREEAIARVDAAADEAWKDTAYKAAVYVAERRAEFTSDDIWEALAKYYPDLHVAEARAMGAILRRVVAAGVAEIKKCEHCGTLKVMTQSRRPQANGMDTPVYRSLVHGRPSE